MHDRQPQVLEKKNIITFILITSLFSLWGFANDITNPLVAAFQTLLEISSAKAAMVQLAFYGGYFTMAIPAALFARRYSYKRGIQLGLLLYAVGAFIFYPAAHYQVFYLFLIALYILTFGLAFLETVANPYILSMGTEETATRRLNLAQAFNPVGSLLGMFVASNYILASLQSDERGADGSILFFAKSELEKQAIIAHDMALIRNPYLAIGAVVLLILVIISVKKMPDYKGNENSSALEIFGRLIKNRRYTFGVIAQAFYVAAQIMCWTFIIQYAENLGYSKAEAQTFNIIAMVIFLSSRFISTYLMKYVNAARLMGFFALGGVIALSGTILLQNDFGLYSLIATSGFMSLMFPTIYGMALHGLGEDAKLGAAGLIMAIVGGALMPMVQGKIVDMGEVFGLPAINFSFILPLISFVVIGYYARSYYKEFSVSS